MHFKQLVDMHTAYYYQALNRFAKTISKIAEQRNHAF